MKPSKIHRTVMALDRLAVVTQLASFLVKEGLVQQAIIIPPSDLSKGEVIWPPIDMATN